MHQRIISAGIIVFRRTPDGIKFLILYHRGNYWNFPKGRIEAGERSSQSALREVEEETGLKPKEIRFVGGFKTSEKFFYRQGTNQIFKIVILYLAETRQRKISVSEEHEGYGWFTFPEAKRVLSKYQASIRIITQAYEYITKRRYPHDEEKKPEARQGRIFPPKSPRSGQAHPARQNFDLPGGGHPLRLS